LLGVFISISLTQDLGMRLSESLIRYGSSSWPWRVSLVICLLLGFESQVWSQWHRLSLRAIWQFSVFWKQDILSGC